MLSSVLPTNPRIIVPPPILKNDNIAVISPAGPISADDFIHGNQILCQHYQTVFNDTIFCKAPYLAGSDAQRSADFQAAIDCSTNKGIIATRGGFGTSRILNHLEFSTFKQKPKWIVGCSDLTAALIHLWCKMKLITIHGPMVTGLGKIPKEDVTRLMDLLAGKPTLPFDALFPGVPGVAVGPLLGGNLTILAHMCGSIAEKHFRNAILFIEDIGEMPYRIDRCLTQLERAGILDQLSGIIMGEFTQCGSLKEQALISNLVQTVSQKLKIPMAQNFPAAHGKRNVPFYHGAQTSLSVTNQTVTCRQLPF